MECPSCGREVEQLEGGLCTRCVSEREAFLVVPDVLDVVRCAHCGRLDNEGTWVEAPKELRDAARHALQVRIEVEPPLVDAELQIAFDWEDGRNATARTALEGRYGEHRVERSGLTRVRMKQGACPDCSRRFGGYFEAIIQLRSSEEGRTSASLVRMGGWLDREMDRLGGEGRTGAYVSRAEKVRGGFDYYLGSQEIARIVGRGLSEHWGAQYQESIKLVGRRDGADLYRVTILVRLPPYAPGDFVEIEGRPFKVLGFERKTLLLWDLERRARVRREPKRLGRIRVIGGPEEERPAVVVSRHLQTTQILDPVTLHTVDLEAPEVPPGTEQVRVLRWNDRVYVVPEEARATYTRP